VRKQEVYFRVPGLFFSPLIKKPREITTLGSHIDFAPTLLDMLKIYSPNSFLGTSLLRETNGPRFVFMVHDDRWNLRTENEIVYDTGPETFQEHFPFPEPNQKISIAALTHAGYASPPDLLTETNPQKRKPLEPNVLSVLEQVANITLDAYMITLVNDRISNPRDAFWDKKKGHQEPLKKTRFTDQEKFIAHAGGEIKGIDYSNSLEALNSATAKGIRFIEVDISETRDGKYVLLHNWEDDFRKLFNTEKIQRKEDIPTESEFKKLKMIQNLTALTLPDLIRWLDQNPQVSIITDFKIPENKVGLQFLREHYPQHINRFIPQVYEFTDFLFAQSMGYEKIILTLYRLDASDSDILSFVKENDIYALTMPQKTRGRIQFGRKLKFHGNLYIRPYHQ